MDEIKTLLSKFYDGQTTETEENRLREFFNGTDIPEELAAEARYFSMPPAPPEGMERRLAQQIDAWNMIEKTTARKTRTIGLRWTMGIAASLLVLLSFGVYLNTRQATQPMAARQDTYDDPRDAYAETQKALVLFSNKLNKGLGSLENKSKEQ